VNTATLFIAHRGNCEGPDVENENDPSYVDRALERGFHAEVDLWSSEGALFLGHDFPSHSVDIAWLLERKDRLWVHCKNGLALAVGLELGLSCFGHQKDPYVAVSNGWIWCYPGFGPFGERSVCVLPEWSGDRARELASEFSAICSDWAVVA